MIKLYGVGFSNNVNKVRYCLHYLDLAYDWVETNPRTGENRTPEFLGKFPTGKIPAIEIDGFGLFESNAIIKYLAVMQNSSLYPKDAKKRAVIDAWMDYGSIHVSAAVSRVFYNRVLAPVMNQKADENSIKAGLEFLDKFFPVIEKQLTDNLHLAGADLSLADINLLAALDPCELSRISLEGYPAVVKWRNNMKAQSFYQKCFKDYTQYIQEIAGAKV